MQMVRKRNFATKSLAVLLAMLMLVSAGMTAFALNEEGATESSGEVANLTETQIAALETVREFNENAVGLVGFYGVNALPTDDTQVPVIVIFNSNPAATQVAEAAAEGNFMALSEAQAIIESEHEIFARELAGLFAVSPFARGRNAAPQYHVTIEYRHTMSGVAMTLPASAVEAMSEISVVQAVLPDFVLNPPEITEAEYNEGEVVDTYMYANELVGIENFSGFEPAEAATTAAAPPWGNAQGRSRMNANELHRRGIDGTGIIVAVIDTGIDWMHPAFAGSFPPADVINEARIARFGPNGTAGHNPILAAPLTQNELFNINRYDTGGFDQLGFPRAGQAPEYVFLGRDNMRLWPGGGGDDPRGNPIAPGGTPINWAHPQLLPPGMPGNNPAECSPLYFWNELGQNMRTIYNLLEAGPTSGIPGASWHGTHVAGTILARPYPAPDQQNFNPQASAMGVAPGAWGIHYRGLYGHGHTYASIWISAQEWAFLDGANVVNLSLGAQYASAVSIINISINNIMLADPSIVFVAAAGNSGNQFFTGGNPGGSQMAITAAALTEPTNATVSLSSEYGGISATATFLHTSVRGTQNVLANGRTILNHPIGTRHNDGVMTVIALPLIDHGLAGGGLDDVLVGSGTQEEFEAMVAIHGAEALNGNFVLIRRGSPFVEVSQRAADFGLGGVIMINGTAAVPAATSALHIIPYLSIPQAPGTALLTAITASEYPVDHVGTFILDRIGNMGIAAFSSRGPLDMSFDISPDVGAHGSAVLSTQPRFTAGGMPSAANPLGAWRNTPWTTASLHTRSAGGTSMASPHVAGAVALMQQYSAENAGGMWANYEIKSRLTNTAIEIAAGNSPFDAGRHVDVLAAVETNTVVMVQFDNVVTDLFVPFNAPNQTRVPTLTGAMSFGGFNRNLNAAGTGARNIGHGTGTGYMRVYITNNSDEAITYNISHRFVTDRAARPAGTPTAALSGASLTHRLTFPIAAGQTLSFDAILTLPANGDLGFYEGFITVSGGSHDLVLPFAAVTYDREPSFIPLGLYRPVVTTNTEAIHNMTSNELIMQFRQSWGFSAVFYLIDAVPAREAGLTPANWLSSTIELDGTHRFIYEDYILGTTVGTREDYRSRWARHFPRNRGGNNAEDTMRGVIFDGYFIPGTHEHPDGVGDPIRLDREGEFYIGISVFRQSPNATLPGAGVGQSNWWAWEGKHLIPFVVDNTAPEINSLTFNGVALNMEETPEHLNIRRGTDDLVVTGNVSDLWLENAIANGVTFDVFTNPGEALVNIDNLALWVHVGENTVDNRPVRAEIDEDGYFEVSLIGVLETDVSNVTVWLVDGYAPVPVVNQTPIGTGNPLQMNATWWNVVPPMRTLPVNTYFVPGGNIEIADTQNLRQDVLFGARGSNNAALYNLPAAEFNRFALAGLNVTELTLELRQTARADLEALLAFVATLDRVEGGFTAVTWTRLQSANVAGIAVLNNPNATHAQIEAAVRNLINTLEALNPPVQIP